MTTIERPETLRQTLLGLHNHCPHSAYLSLKHDGGGDSHQMARGTAFHEVAERAITEMIEQSEPKMPGELCRDLADLVLAERTDLVISTEEQDATRLMAFNFGEGFVADPAAIVGVEVPMEIELGGFTLTGKIDLIEVHGQTIYLRDWKTSLAIRKNEEVQKGFQGLFYAMLCLYGVQRETKMSLGAGIADVWFYETYPRYRTDEGGMVTKEGVWTKAEVFEFKTSLERNVARFEESLETGDWPARDGSWCSICPAAAECPIPADLRFDGKVIESEEEAHEVFSLKLAAERDSRRMQSALRGWVEEHGPIFNGDLAFDAAVSQSKSVKDWDLMLLALLQTTQIGTPFEVTDHVTIRQSTKFAKRKQTEEEMSDG